MRRTPEQRAVDELAAIEGRFDDLWELVESTGMNTAKVWASRNGAAGTTFGSLMQETSEKLHYLFECAELLRDEAEEV